MHVLATYICIQLCSSRVHAVAIFHVKALIIAIESAESFCSRFKALIITIESNFVWIHLTIVLELRFMHAEGAGHGGH
jgi:hypothetical protein